MKTRCSIIAVSLSIFLCASARAELKWEKTTVELHPAIGDKQAVGQFKYKNVGDKPVRILSVKTSCGCTTTALKKNDVAPGESGEITATFTIGNRTGMQQKSVNVTTDDPQNKTTVLMLQANIVQALALNPAFVFWQAGEEAKPKTIIARAGKEIPIKNLDVVSSSPDFLTKVEPGSSPGEFKINVQPRQTAKAVMATLKISPDYPKGSPQFFYATARVTGVPASVAR